MKTLGGIGTERSIGSDVEQFPKARGEYDLMTPRENLGLIVSPATDVELDNTLPLMEAFFGAEIANPKIVHWVQELNRLSVWAIKDAKTGVGLGCYSQLFLSPLGKELAEKDQLDARTPQRDWLASSEEPPAAVYKWLMVARGRAFGGIPMVASFMRQPRFAKLDYFAGALTPSGADFLERYGFEKISPGARTYRYERLANRAPLQEMAS